MLEMEVEAGSHCIYQIRYHLVMCVKYRKQLLAGRERGEAIRKIFREVGERYWYRMEDVGTDGDHVHVFCWGSGEVGAVTDHAGAQEHRCERDVSAISRDPQTALRRAVLE